MFGLWLQCPLPVPAVRFPSGSETSRSWRGAAPSCCCVLQTPQVPPPGLVLSPAPCVASLCQHSGQGGASPTCRILPIQSKPCGWYSHGTWGFIPWRLFQLPEGLSSALPLCSHSVDAAEEGALVPGSVWLEDVLKKSCWLWGSSWFQLEAAAGLFALPSGWVAASVSLQVPVPSQSVWSPFHTCNAAVLRSFFPGAPWNGVGKQGRNDVVSRVLARTEVVYAFY